MSVDALLQVIVPASCPARTVLAALEGGVDLVQLREKGCSTVERITRFRALSAEIARHDVPVLVNDDVEAARVLEARGVHLGQGDGDPAEARRRLGPEAWIGLSTHGPAEIEAAPTEVSHFGLGACHPTTTKQDTRPLREDELRESLRRATRPVFAIGGIDLERLPALIAVGVRRIAVSSAILDAPDPRRAAAALRTMLVAAAGQ